MVRNDKLCLLLKTLMSKIIKDTEINTIKQDGVVLVGGCFDVLHEGHKKFLALSKKEGEKLVVFLESDANITKLKGKNRPMNTQIVRAENLSKLNIVDYIILLNTPKTEQYYYNLVKSLEPDIIAVTAGDEHLSEKNEQAKQVKGKVVEVMKRENKYSTTKIIKNMRVKNKPSIN